MPHNGSVILDACATPSCFGMAGGMWIRSTHDGDGAGAGGGGGGGGGAGSGADTRQRGSRSLS
jgi:hypothetical protein